MGRSTATANRFWNATDACCNFDKAGVDDVAYLTGIIDEIRAKLAIDPKRIAFVGHSNGGFMSYRMACDRAGLVAAIVSLAGATFADPTDCAPSEPVSVAQIHGTADDVIRYDGGGLVNASYPSAETTAEAWATYDGCGESSSPLSAKVDVDATLSDGADPAETSVAEWSGCKSGVAVQLWTIPDGGHVPVHLGVVRRLGHGLPGRPSKAVTERASFPCRQGAAPRLTARPDPHSVDRTDGAPC